MARILLIRHGQASFGGEDYDRLSPLGERQAQIVGEHLKRMGRPIAALYSGDMLRQADTADIAARTHGALPARQVDPAFNEYDAGGLFRSYLPAVLSADPELAAQLAADRRRLFKDKKLFQRVFERLVVRWLVGEAAARGQMESWQAFVARVEAGLARLRERYGKDDVVAVFTSGGSISVAVRAALSLQDEMTLRVNWGIANASITRLHARRSGYYLGEFNNVTHLELTGDPALITYR